MSRSNLALATLFLSASAIFAQVSGRVTGTVIDPTGAVVPNATISLFLPGGKTALLTTTTDSTGNFALPSVRPELYTLVVEGVGFATYTKEQVKIDPARELALPPIQLALAGTSQEVDVISAGEAIDRNSAEIATTVTQQQVQSLPVVNRQLRFLFILNAGVSKTPSVSTVVNGMRSTYTNLTLDGIAVQDAQRTNAADFVPNLITLTQVKEFTISTSNANPTVGGAASTIALVTPSGTNELHGSAYWYNRNSYFGANDWFNNKNRVARPFLNLNQPGGSLGGPVIQDKLFFFGNYEALRGHQTLPKTQTILTPTARQGILQYRVGSTVQQFNVLSAAQVQPSPFIANFLSEVPADGNNNSIGDDALRIDVDAGGQTRILHFPKSQPKDGGKRSLQGISSAEWERPAAGTSLRVGTRNLRPGYLRKNGVPYSEDTVLTEYFDVVQHPEGDQYLILTSVVQDPNYLSQPFVTSTHFKKQADASGWNPSGCSAR